ncbi:MAG TPA: condensation domain-containing protein, partial [Bacillota bacterium]|nr:condensation domain-containing protein [Bacillota bacterium]
MNSSIGTPVGASATAAERSLKPAATQAEERRASLLRQLLPAGQSPPTPLSFAQERLWFLDQLEPNSPLYNMLSVARLTGTLHRAAFEQSVAAILARHESLRTRFLCLDGEPFQVIDAAANFTVPCVDLADRNEPERETELQRLLRAEASRPFNLSTDRLLRVTMVRLRPQEHVLLLTMHHIISDEWS